MLKPAPSPCPTCCPSVGRLVCQRRSVHLGSAILEGSCMGPFVGASFCVAHLTRCLRSRSVLVHLRNSQRGRLRVEAGPRPLALGHGVCSSGGNKLCLYSRLCRIDWGISPPFSVAADCVCKLIEESVPVGSGNVLAYSVADVGPAWLTKHTPLWKEGSMQRPPPMLPLQSCSKSQWQLRTHDPCRVRDVAKMRLS